MKKSLLLSTALLVGVGAFAQTNRQMGGKKLYAKARPQYSFENAQSASTQRTIPSVNGTQSYIVLDACTNGVGMINEDNNTLSYNKDLNMILFVNRIPPVGSWPMTGLPSTGVSGFMVARYSMDNGATWNRVCFANNGVDFSRHPSGVIANAPGNTDPALAKIVGAGPALGGGAAFTHSWFASVAANATGNVTNNDQQTVDASIGSGTFAQHSSIYSNGMISNGLDVWLTGRSDDGTNYQGVNVFKGTTSGGAYTWTQDSVTFGPYYQTTDGSLINNSSLPRIAFSPNRMIGYVLVNGVLANATGESTKYMKPNLWKTTDGGATWNLVNQNYDWKANHPEILCNLIPTSNDIDWNGGTVNETYPSFLDAHGSGVTVDNNGVLHYVTTVVPAPSSHPDSVLYLYTNYGFSSTQYDDLDKPWIYDFTTDGNGTWNQKLIGKLYTRNILATDANPVTAAWTYDGTATQAYTNRIRVARSDDGTKIFYTWTDGDTTAIVGGSYAPNKYPALMYKAYDVSTDMFTTTKEMSVNDAAEGGYYLYYSSTTAVQVGQDYNLPVVYISSQDGELNLSNAVDFNYITDMNFLSTDYTQTIVSNTNFIADQNACVDVVGIKEVVGNDIKGVSQNYPNPFNGTSMVRVNLNKADDITVNVTNSIGQVVATQTVKGNVGSNEVTIDASNLNTGIYFYTVLAGNSKVTRKMSVTK